MEWPFKQNFSTCTFHILNGTVALICFVVVFVFDSLLWFSSSFGLG